LSHWIYGANFKIHPVAVTRHALRSHFAKGHFSIGFHPGQDLLKLILLIEDVINKQNL
jgi:hypothetical protein